VCRGHGAILEGHRHRYHLAISTFVLVHGAMHGSWCWRDVRRRLTEGGHQVFTPTLTGQGDRRSSCTPEVGVSTHVTDISDLLWFEDLTEVNLVLHSYAGILAGPIVTRSADRVDSVTLLGGFITRPGECLLDVEPDEVAARYRRQAEDSGGGWLIPADPSFLTQWGVTDGDLAAWVGPRLTDFPLRCQTEPTTFDQASLARVRRAYVRHTDPPLASLERSHRRAVSDGWDCRDVTAGHDMMLEVPDIVAGLLVELAAAP
jgi:pimeloyl-ACP methyl ester carboxylesterase